MKKDRNWYDLNYNYNNNIFQLLQTFYPDLANADLMPDNGSKMRLL